MSIAQNDEPAIKSCNAYEVRAFCDECLLARSAFSRSLFFSAGCETMPQGIQQARIDMARADPGRTAGRLFYRAPLFQTGLQILGLRAAAGPALEHSAAGDVERKTEARARPRTAEFRQRQQLRIQTLRATSAETTSTSRRATAIYPEFVLKSYELISTNPPPIFKSQYSGRARPRVTATKIEKPE